MAAVNLRKVAQSTKDNRPIYIYTLIIVIVAFGLMLLASVAYTNNVAQRNEREWCELLEFYDDYYSSHPPQTPLQQQQSEMMHRRVMALGCE